MSIHQSSNKFQLEIEYHDKIIKIEKEILGNNVYENEILIEKEQILNEEKYVSNSFQPNDLPKSPCNKLIYYTDEIDRIKTDNEKLTYICDVCNQSFNSKKKLICHIRNHFSNGFDNNKISNICSKNIICKQIKNESFKCEICEEHFSSQCSYNTHVNIHSKNKNNILKKSFTCKFCGKHFNDQSNCNRHTKIHFQTNNKLNCDICKKTFSGKYGLKVHMRMHVGINPYKCEICELRFYRNDILQIHMSKMHRVNCVNKHIYCNECSKQFSTKSTLMRHKMIHSNEKLYTCNKCQKSYSRKDSFITHFRSKHSGEKPYLCHICKKSFFEKNVLVRHMKIYTHCN